MFEAVNANQGYFLFLLALGGLIIGSFLNVVIHRLPIMLKKQWANECIDFLQEIPNAKKSKIWKTLSQKEEAAFNLLVPSSHCPRCTNPLKWWHNIPVISYILLNCQCAYCKTTIPLRYPLVEFSSALIAVIAGIEFGGSLACVGACVFGWSLLTLSFIDFEHKIVPDIIVFPVLWIGLLLSCFETFTNSNDAIVGVIIGYIFLWATGKLYALVRRKEGIGLGDCKLLAAIGAWVGWQLLPFVILVGSFLGLIIGTTVLFYKKLPHHVQIPFVPFLGIAAWIALIWGFDVTKYYLEFFDISWTNV